MTIFRQTGFGLVPGQLVPEHRKYTVLPEKELQRIALSLCAQEAQPTWRLGTALGSRSGGFTEKGQLVIENLVSQGFLTVVVTTRNLYKHKWYHVTITGLDHLRQLEEEASQQNAKELAKKLVNSMVKSFVPTPEVFTVSVMEESEKLPSKPSRCVCGTFKKHEAVICNKCIRRQEKPITSEG